MKQLQSLIFLMLMYIAVGAHALDQEMQVDLLMAKINSALNAGKPAEALPFYAQLDNMGPSLKNPLKESFYFSYINTLDKAGDRANAVSRSDAYLSKYGKKAAHYDQVIEIMSRQEIGMDKDSKARAQAQVDGQIAAKNRHEQTLNDMRACKTEAVALEKLLDALKRDDESLKKQTSSLELRKVLLDSQESMLRTAQYPMPFIEQQFNVDSQSFNKAVREQNQYVREYESDRRSYESRLGRYKNGCGQLSPNNDEVAAVCSNSSDWFCARFK
jgi:hypothetical protein